jgi:hypothetical protein
MSSLLGRLLHSFHGASCAISLRIKHRDNFINARFLSKIPTSDMITPLDPLLSVALAELKVLPWAASPVDASRQLSSADANMAPDDFPSTSVSTLNAV